MRLSGRGDALDICPEQASPTWPLTLANIFTEMGGWSRGRLSCRVQCEWEAHTPTPIVLGYVSSV